MPRRLPRLAGRRTRRALTALTATALGVGGLAAAAPAPAPVRPASVLAKIEGGFSPAAARALAARHGMTVLRQFPQIGWVELGLRAGDGAAQRRSLLRDPRVFRIDDARPGQSLLPTFQPRDAFNRSDLLGPSNAPLNYHWSKTNFFGAWDRSQGSSTTPVAVIDSEFDTENPDLKAKLRSGWNVDSGTPEYHTGNVRARVVNNQFVEQLHGSHTAGLVGAATDNNLLVSGACFECTVIPVKIGLGSSGDAATDAKFIADLDEGIIWAADHGATVISMSLGTPRFAQSLQDAINYAAARGIVLVASSGNSQESPTNRGIPQYPAALQNIIAVAATVPTTPSRPSPPTATSSTSPRRGSTSSRRGTSAPPASRSAGRSSPACSSTPARRC
jgi:thermitase